MKDYQTIPELFYSVINNNLNKGILNFKKDNFSILYIYINENDQSECIRKEIRVWKYFSAFPDDSPANPT